MCTVRMLIVVSILPVLFLSSCATLSDTMKAQNANRANRWSATSPGTYTVEINDTGFTDLRHLNFRNPPNIADDPNVTEQLQFVNRTADRRVKVSIKVADAQCATPPCTVEATLSPGDQFSLLADELKEKVLTEFRIRFEDGTDSPSNSIGYITWKATELPKNAPDNQYLILGGINGQVEPKLDLSAPTDITKPTTLGTDNPYKGGRRRFFKGTASFEPTIFVKDWGRAEGSITLKDAEYGRDSTLNISASRYSINLLSIYGFALRFGKFVFATPSSKVALNEAGEGFQLDLSPLAAFKGNLNLSVITKRQRHPDATTEPTRDDTMLLAQYTNIPFPISTKFFRTMSFYGLFGRDENKKDEHSYSTAGTEITMAVPRTTTRGSYSGSTSFYVGRRGIVNDGTSKGGVFYTTLSYNTKRDEAPKDKKSNTWSVNLGVGSKDDPTTTRDEGYASENQGFSPDIIFFALLAKPIRQGKTPGIGFGLANKTYVGFSYSTDHWSLLREVAKLIDREGKEIRSWNTTISLHKYNLRADRPTHPGRDAGWEGDIKFFVETLPKVKVNLGFGYYKRGKALEDFIRKDMWAITSGIVIEK
jgi:hypothetical protein